MFFRWNSPLQASGLCRLEKIISSTLGGLRTELPSSRYVHCYWLSLELLTLNFYFHYSRRSLLRCWVVTFLLMTSTSWRVLATRRPPSTKSFTEGLDMGRNWRTNLHTPTSTPSPRPIIMRKKNSFFHHVINWHARVMIIVLRQNSSAKSSSGRSFGLNHPQWRNRVKNKQTNKKERLLNTPPSIRQVTVWRACLFSVWVFFAVVERCFK